MTERRTFTAPGGAAEPQAERRPGPDVSTAEIAGAGYVAEAVETDRWFLSHRERRGYRRQALEIAAGMGHTPDFYGPSQQRRAAGGMSILPPDPVSDDPGAGYEARETEAIMAARRADPSAFEGVPVTTAEIEQAVRGDLRAQWEDAQRTLDLAPQDLLGRYVPEFAGRMGAAATDEVNAPLAVAAAPLGAGMTLGRTVLMEGALGVAGEGLTLPKQYRQAERLDLPEPNAAAQLVMGGLAGAALPVAIRGVGQGVQAGRQAFTNSQLVRQYRARASDLSPIERASLNRVETYESERTTSPAARGDQAPAAGDRALADMELGRPPDDGPLPDPAKAEALTTPAAPAAPVAEPDPGIGRANDPVSEADAGGARTPEPRRGVVDNLRAAIREHEARGSYDTPSDYTVVAPPRPVTEMTLDEIDAWQAANQRAGAQSTAVGGYQIIRDTLQSTRRQMGLTGSETFTPELQDRMAAVLLEGRGLSDFRAGAITADQFADNLAQEWAALPLVTGRSYYAGDGLNAATIDRDTIMGILGGQSYTQTGKPPPTMTRFPVASLGVDARTYQFRTEVDAEGVGTALDRVTEWDEMLAGDMIVHERLDGGRYIADGHHRRQLAARLEAEGHAPISGNGFILREADGYTVQDVRAIAAIKNIEAGNASAVDAAKVLRVDPAMLDRLSLRQSHVRDARGLMKLGDESFDMVTNGQVAEGHAAVVGELTADADMQRAIMSVLISTRPKSLAEARQTANDAYRLGLEQGQASSQGSLFGDAFDVQETLFAERARVMARAMSQLRNDRRVFSTLVRESDRITETGNVLTTETNRGRANVSGQALDLIERLVNRAGPLDSALTDAARRLRSGERIGAATDGFVESVRGEIEGGGLARLMDGGDGGAVETAQAGARAGAGPGDSADAGRIEAEPEAGAARSGGGTEITNANAASAADAAGRDDGGAVADMFADPSPDAPGPRAQTSAAEVEIRDAIAAGEDLDVPTGREVDGAPETLSMAELIEDLDADNEFLEQVNACRT